MRFLHTSDWHLGAMDCERSLWDDQKFFIDEILKVIREEKIDAVLLAGDVFDRSVASSDAIKLYDYAMTEICSGLGVPVLMIAGNHDSADRLASCRELLASAGLYICGALTAEPQKKEYEDVEVYFLPWITEEKVKSLYPARREEITSLEVAYRVVTDTMRAGFAPGKKHFILAHAFITDSETSTSDRAAEIGFATQVPAGVFEGFDYVALGHIHKPQDVNDKIRYSGTPMPYSFGKEEKQEKSVTIIDTASRRTVVRPLPLLHHRTTLTGTLDELMNPEWEKETLNGYVRLKVTDAYVGLETLTELKKLYPLLLEVSGRSFEGENSTVSITVDELEKIESNPVEVFNFFCRDIAGIEPDDHLHELFLKAVEEGENE